MKYLLLFASLLLGTSAAVMGPGSRNPGAVATGEARLAASALSESSKDAWSEYRRATPFHAQDVAVSEDGRVVIVSEPPPHLDAAQIAAILGADKHAVLHHPIGYDGWVADVVCELPPQARSALHEQLTELAIEMFGSAFGFEYLQLPIEQSSGVTQQGLDVRVGADDLHRWMFEDAMVLMPVEGGRPTHAAELLATGAEGVYESEEPGLVVLAFDRDSAVEDREHDWRRWLLESDLILGGVRGASSILVVGRTRQLSLNEVPPLRVEEVQRLAAVDDSELAQSYERNHLLAGRWDGLQFHDWAPIYLSAALLDTEYGSLLNVTDQLLKSWSQVGDIEYVNFPYPDPSEYPFEDRLSDLMPGDSLTFNWNTTGVGHVLQASSLEVYAVNRTGALPVTYIPSGMLEENAAMVERLEEQGYQNFAASGNIHLARVVQYASLYQMCRAFDIRSGLHVLESIPDEGDATFRNTIADLLKRIRAMEPMEIMWNAGQVAEASAPLMDNKGEADRFRFVIGQQLSGTIEEVKVLLEQGVADYGESYIDLVARVMAQPRLDAATLSRIESAILALQEVASEEDFDEQLLELEDRECLEAYSLAQTLVDPETSFPLVVSHLVDTDEAMEEYAIAFQAARNPGWICTPSIVQSEDTATVDMIGGHNVDSRVLRIVEDAGQGVGKPKVTLAGDDIVVRINPADRAGSSQAIRRIARSSDPVGVAPSAFKKATQDWAKLPRELKPRLQIGGAPPSGPPRGRVALGSSYPEPPSTGFTFPEGAGERVAVMDAGGRVSTNGRSFYKAETIRAKSDRIVRWIESRSPREGDNFVVNISKDAMSEGEAVSLHAQLGTLLPRRVSVSLRYGKGSALESVDLRRAIASEVSSIDGGRTFVVELTEGSGQKLTVTARLKRAISGTKDKLQGFFGKLPNSPDPVNAQSLKIRMETIPGLEDVKVQVQIPAGAEAGVIITEALDHERSEGARSRAA